MSEIFNHIKEARKDLSLPGEHHKTMDAIGWVYDLESFQPQVNGKKAEKGLDDEMLETLTNLTEQERFDLAADNTLAVMYGDITAVEFNARLARSSIAVKQIGRKSIETILGGMKQTVSVPTTMQKVRRILTGGRGEKREEEVTEGYEAEVNG